MRFPPILQSSIRPYRIYFLNMLAIPIILACAVLERCLGADDKWVWGSGRSAKLARLDSKGRYGVYEPEIPDEPYIPHVRPPPKDLPPLVRPSSSFNERPFARPSFPSDNRPYENRPYENRPHERPYRPYEPNRPFEHNKPYVPTKPFPNRPLPPPPEHRGEPHDPTKFDKCKCTHSFNCKSPGIVFGSCDVGKKYCCEKFRSIPHRGPGGPVDDLTEPEVLAGPGGPVDHLPNRNPQLHRPCNGLSCYTSEIQGRRP